MKQDVSKEVKEALAKEHACYVLITCSEPTPEGKMDVQMNYEGDPVLAAYLLQGAQSYLDEIEVDEGDIADSELSCLSE